MKKFTKKYLSVVVASILFAGCSLTSHEAFNEDINQMKEKDSKKIILDGKEMPNITDGVKHEINKPKFIQISSPMNLSTILKELGKVEDREYYLQKEQEDLTIPPSAIKIRNFADLQLYVEDTLEQNIFITKNAAIKDRLKIVKVRDIGAKKLDLNKVPFTLNGQISTVKALKLLEEIPDFTFSINIKFEDFEYKSDEEGSSSSSSSAKSQNQLFDETAILFNGNTVGNFFDYLREKQNLFIDVDYEKKIVKIYKYKQEFVQLTTGNIQIKGTLTDSSTQVTSGASSSGSSGGGASGSSNSGMERSVDIDIIKRVKEVLDVEIANSKAKGNKRIYANVIEQSGTVVMYADADTIKNIQKQINRFNLDYSDSIEIEYFAFDIILDKSYVFESGVSRNVTSTKDGVDKTQTLDFNSILSNTMASATKKTSEGINYSVVLNSLDKYGFVSNHKQKKWVVRNHIPKNDTETASSRYLKDIKVVSPTVAGGTTETQTESAEIIQPQNFDVVAHLNNGKIAVQIKQSQGKLISMEDIKSGNTILNNPKTESKSESIDAQIKDGDSYVTTTNRDVRSAKEYKGMLPTDLLISKIVGGGIDDGFVYKNSYVIITARKIPN